MSVLDIVSESDAYSRLRHLVSTGNAGESAVWRKTAAKARNAGVNASRFSDLRALGNFPFKRARCVRSTVPAVDDLFGRLAPERVRHIRASRGSELVHRVRDGIAFHV